MGLVLINGVVDASTNFIDSTPTGATANVGDRIFKTKKGELLEFDDISISTSQSYAFDGNSGIKVDESKLNDFDSDTRFSQQFWVYRTDPTINTNTPLLSYTLDKLDSSVRSEDSSLNIQLHHHASVTSWSPFRDNTLLDNTNMERKTGSLYLPSIGINSATIDSAGHRFIIPSGTASLDSNQTMLNYTLHSYIYDIDDMSDISLNNNQTIASTSDNSLIFNQREITIHGLPHNLVKYDSNTARADGNAIMPADPHLTFTQAGANLKDPNKWQHHAIMDDGYDRSVLKQGVRYYTVPSDTFMFDAGPLTYKKFHTDKDAAFSTKVFFPTTAGASATLFTMGNDPTNITSIHYNIGSGLLELKCAQLNATVDISSHFTNSEKVVAWDIRINPGRFRVWINDSCIANLNTNSPLNNYQWASGISGGVLEVINPSSTTFQPSHTISTNNTLVDATSISNGNLFFNSTLNDVGTYFLLDNIIGNNKAYYFEMEWIGGYSGLGAKYYTKLRPHIINSGHTGNQFYPLTISSNYSFGKQFATLNESFYGSHFRTPLDNFSAVPANPITDKFFTVKFPLSGGNLQHGYLMRRRTFSFYVDFGQGIMFTLLNGWHGSNQSGGVLSNSRWAILPFNSSGNFAELGFHRATYHEASPLSGGDVKFNPSYTLNETTFKLAFDQGFGNENYAPHHRYGTSGNQFIRKTQPDVEIRFNPTTWKYDPVTLINDVVKPLIDNFSGGMGTGNFFPTNNLPVHGFYASGENIDNWFSTGSYKKLKYYSQTHFKSFPEQSLKIGSSVLKINSSNTDGLTFANEYIAKTGGSIVNVTGGGNINANINSANEGDALLLGPGTYSIDAKSAGYYGETDNTSYRDTSIFLGKKIAIIGNTSTPGEVVINYTPHYQNNLYYYFSVWNKACNENCKLAFVKLKRDLSAFNHNYNFDQMNTLHHASKGGEAKSVIFDFTNSFSARSLDSRRILGGFMFAYDGTDNANIILRNRRFADCFFTGYTESRFIALNASSGSYVERLGLHNLAFKGVVPGSYKTHMSGTIISHASDDNVIFTDSTAHAPNFRGYFNGLELTKGIAFDSTDFRIPNPVEPDGFSHVNISDDSVGLKISNLRDIDATAKANRSFRLKASSEIKTLLTINDSGAISTSVGGLSQTVGSFSVPVNTWTHCSLSWDHSTNTAKVRKNGNDVADIPNFFDSHFLDSTSLLIGANERYVPPGRFDKNYAIEGLVLKDFELTDSDITNDSAPTADIISTSKTKLLTANDGALQAQSGTTFIAGAQNTAQHGITGNLFSPYLENDRNFFVRSVSAPGYTAVSKVVFNGEEEVALAYPDSVATGLTDSPDFQVLVRLGRFDADGDSISWEYSEDNFPRRIIVGHDDSGYIFQIKKFKYEERNDSSPILADGFHHNAKVTFTPSKISKDSSPMMLHLPNNDDKVIMPPMGVIYDRFGAELTNVDNFLPKYMSIEPFDSDANTTISFIYDSYPHVNSISGIIPGTSTKVSTIKGPVYTLDSLGALP